MTQTPLANRKHVAVFGKTNAGKSTLFNAILGQDAAIVSEQKGTTTDPVIRAMELLPYGPIALVDTAGLGDETALGAARVKRTEKMLERTDLALFAAEAAAFSRREYEEALPLFRRWEVPCLLVLTKADLCPTEALKSLRESEPEAIFVSEKDASSILALKSRVSELLSAGEEEQTLLGGLLREGDAAVLVTPIDSEAPKGRLILPQVQLIRDCLDHGVQAVVCRETELEAALRNTKTVRLVVTDSQAFRYVSERVPEEIPLTSFSILFGRFKGSIEDYVAGARALGTLQDGDRIAVTEGCTHNRTHEDIGRVKLPAAIRKRTGRELTFDFFSGHDFPEDLSVYRMVIQCGGCMQSRREVLNRIRRCREAGVAITNYGTMLAELTGILDRSVRILRL